MSASGYRVLWHLGRQSHNRRLEGRVESRGRNTYRSMSPGAGSRAWPEQIETLRRSRVLSQQSITPH